MTGLFIWAASAVISAGSLSLPTEFTVTPLTPTSTSPIVYSQASINNNGDVVYLQTQVGLRAIQTDGTNDRSLGIGWVVSNPAVNNSGQFLCARGSSGSQLWLSTLTTSPTGVDLINNPLYTGSKSSLLPDLNDNGDIVFNNGGNTLWLTDTTGTFFTDLSSITGMYLDGSSRVSINNAGTIVFSNGGDIFKTDTLGSTPVNLTASVSQNLRNPDINNNGIIVARDALTHEIWMLDLFGSDPVQLTSRTVDGDAEAAQINDDNQIVIPIDPLDASSYRVYLYSPVPSRPACSWYCSVRDGSPDAAQPDFRRLLV